MMSMFEDLSKLSKFIYTHSKSFPVNEKYNTTLQIKRAVISVRLNIREGNVFRDKRKISHFQRALGSLHEVDECMNIAYEMEWICTVVFKDYKKLYWLCLNKLNKLINSIKLISQK